MTILIWQALPWVRWNAVVHCHGMCVGDKLIALRSSGVHSNGYSLVRHLVDGSGLTWADQSPFSEGTLGAALLAPTRLYVKQSLAALNAGGCMH